MSSGDRMLDDNLKTAASNATMTSKTTQNDVIRLCGQVILNQIIDDVKAAKYFSILADETTDVSTTEQMCLLVRFPTNEGVQEAFVGFVEVVNTTGQCLADTI
jgi:Domain of unknown function (DUF4371)